LDPPCLNSGYASKTRAITPATYAAAWDVPLISPYASYALVETIPTPGATISGFLFGF